MKTELYILRKYWSKHKKSAVTLLFAGALLTAIVFVALISLREDYARRFEKAFDNTGHYDILIANSDDELLEKVTEGISGYKYGVINVLGKLGYEEKQFTYGTISDEHNLWHIPLEEGKLPETADEIIADRSVLKACYWLGGCGDTITLGGMEYTVVGIIDENYGKNRQGTELTVGVSNAVTETGYYLPLIFVGESSAEPLYRVDLIGGYFDESFLGESGFYENTEETGNISKFKSETKKKLNELIGSRECWLDISCEYDVWSDKNDVVSLNFLMLIVCIGAVVSVLSVFSVLRGIFAERRDRITLLKRIGMKKSRIALMYALECAVFSIIQIITGLAAGLIAYGCMFLVKISFLGEAPISAFADIILLRYRTLDPFFYAVIISVTVMVCAYLINVLTTNTTKRAQGKRKKPRALAESFAAAVRQGGITVVQTIALTLICFSVITGYMFYTKDGKTQLDFAFNVNDNYGADGYMAGTFNMTENNIEEYYYSDNPSVITITDSKGNETTGFPFLRNGFSQGVNDSVVSELPDGVISTGCIGHTFVAVREEISGLTAIALDDETILQTVTSLADESVKSFFDEETLGSEKMYRIPSKLTDAGLIGKLAECVKSGTINTEKLNSGEEILLVYRTDNPPLEAGETVTVYSVSAPENSYNINEIKSFTVKIGATLKIPSSFDAVEAYAVKSDYPCNFLTTATGAAAIGLPSAAYTEIYSSEKLDGGLIPQTAEMLLTSLSQLKLDSMIETLADAASVILILLVMSLLGFAAYFNGITLKIRQKAYELSVFRAIGMPLSELRGRMFINSVKIPVISAAASYGLVKIMQLVMENKYNEYAHWRELQQNGAILPEQLEEFRSVTDSAVYYFLNYQMWQVSAEIPTLILLLVICAVTFILTAGALKRFNNNIAGDLNSGRTRI